METDAIWAKILANTLGLLYNIPQIYHIICY